MTPTPPSRLAAKRLLPIHLTSRRTSSCSVYNSDEDATTALVSSEVDAKTKHREAGFTAAHAEERSKCSSCKNLSLYQGNFCFKLISHSKHGWLCCDILTVTTVEQRDPSSVRRVRFRKRKEYGRISSPQRETRNLCSMPGNVFSPSAPDEPAASFRNVYAKKSHRYIWRIRVSEQKRADLESSQQNYIVFRQVPYTLCFFRLEDEK